VIDLTQILQQCKQQGITLWNDGGQLRYRAPQQTMTPAIIAALKQHKTAILQALTGESISLSLPAIKSRPDTQHKIPLSFSQQRLWFLYKMYGPSHTYNIPEALRLTGKLDIHALTHALQSLVARHEALRTYFIMEDDKVLQSILPHIDLTINIENLTDQPATQRIELMQQCADHEAQQPFHLEQDNLFRIRLLRLGPHDHVLLFTLHHIIADGWSKAILTRELSHLYQPGNHTVTALPPIRIQYPDYAYWQHQHFSGDAVKHLTDYWLERLQNLPALLSLPLDYARPKQQTMRGNSYFFELPAQQSKALKQLAQQHECSLFMVLLTIFKVLLYRYTKQPDIVVGTNVANRDQTELENTVGFFVNTLVLRTQLDNNPNFIELLSRVKETALGAFNHQAMPFEKLVEALQPERNLAYTPLVQVMFLLQNVCMTQPGLPGLQLESLPVKRDSAKFDLSLIFTETDGILQGEVEYNLDLFSKHSIERLAQHWKILADNILSTPHHPINTLGLTNDHMRWQVTQVFNQTPQKLNSQDTIVNRFQKIVDQHKHITAVTDQQHGLTYTELNQRANRLAHRLLQQDKQTEQIVGICLDRNIDLVSGLLGILKSGAAYVPLDAEHPEARLAFQIQDSKLTTLVTQQKYRAKFETLITSQDMQLIFLDDSELYKQPDHNPEVEIHPQQLAYAIYTSGSTGQPKGTLIEHGSVINLVDALHDLVYHRYLDPIRVALVANVIFDASVQQVFGALLHGHRLHLIDEETRRDGWRLAAAFEQHQITVVDCTPSLLSMMVTAGFPWTDECALDYLLVGGEPLATELVQRFYAQQARTTLINVYGPTECCVDVSAYPIDRHALPSSEIIPLGRPLRNTQLYVLDATLSPVPIGVPGEIYVAGPGLSRGYLHRPELTTRHFVSVPELTPELTEARLYRTGDQARWLADGRLQFLGRLDDQVKIRGHRIELAEIENQLCKHPAVQNAAVSVEDNHGQPQLAAYIVSSTPLSVESLHDYLAQHLATYMLPSQFLSLPELPLTTSGKIDRKKLSASHSVKPLPITEKTYLAPQKPTEKVLAEVWQGVLGIDKISIEDNYFHLGGDSIKALQIVARLQQLGWHMDMREIFAHPTIDQLACHIKPSENNKNINKPATDHLSAPLSAIQQWFFDNFQGRREHYNQTALFKTNQALSTSHLKTALQTLVANHSALRMRFFHEDNQWRQQIVNQSATPILQTVDLRQAHKPLDALTQHATQVQANFDLTSGLLLQAVLYQLADGQRLLLTAHHLVVDAVSWRILLADLHQSYLSLVDKKPIELVPPHTSFIEWSLAINHYANTELSSEIAYWQQQESLGVKQSYSSPSNQLPPDEITSDEKQTIEVELDARQTSLLISQAHVAYNTHADELLITALLIALTKLNVQRPTLLLEKHGRENLITQLDISKTVGWFTSFHPVHFDIDQTQHLSQQIKIVKETLRKVPQHGIGYGLLRYLKQAPKNINFTPLPEISFNYLGQLDADFNGELLSLASENVGPPIDPSTPAMQAIEVLAFILDGKLKIQLTKTGAIPINLTILSQHIMQQLQHIMAHVMAKKDAELTPADIDYDGFDLESLEKFMNHFA